MGVFVDDAGGEVLALQVNFFYPRGLEVLAHRFDFSIGNPHIAVGLYACVCVGPNGSIAQDQVLSGGQGILSETEGVKGIVNGPGE